MSAIGEALKRHEGCNIYGWLELERVAGNIHFAVSFGCGFASWCESRVACGCLRLCPHA